MQTDARAASVATWSFERRLEGAFNRTLPKLGPEARAQLAAIITPEALAIIAAVLVAWVVSHAIGVGQIVDIILLTVGVLSIGLAVFVGLDHLYEFATGTYAAKSESDLEVAAGHLAKAISILGIQAVLAVLFRGAPKTGRGGSMNPGPPPPRNPGPRYQPRVKKDPRLAAGEGYTTFWGDITVSTRGSRTDRAVVLLHEKVHQSLAPRLYLLRNVRVENRVTSYFRSSLWRYLEEALAETIALVGVNGVRQAFVGIRFPVDRGYVYFTKGGGYEATMRGGGIVPEGAGLLGTGVIATIPFQLWASPK